MSTQVFFFVKRCISSNFKFVILFHQQDSKDNKTVPKEQKQEKQDKNDAAEKYVVMNDCCIGFVLFNFIFERRLDCKQFIYNTTESTVIQCEITTVIAG